MGGLKVAIAVEAKKLFRSKIPILTMLALLLVPFMAGFFMFVLRNPDLARSLGFISAKAQIAGAADWPSYLALLAQAVAVGGLIVFGFIISWVFGREYADRTIKDLLALPISRPMIVSAKFIVAAFWCFALTGTIFIISVAVGSLLSLPGWSSAMLGVSVRNFSLIVLLTVLASVPVAFFASAGKGYLPALAFAVLSLVIAQIVTAVGYGEFFPWSVPALASGLAGEDYVSISRGNIFLVLFTALLGWLGTVLWWRFADCDC